MSEAELKPTNEGRLLIERWQEAVRELDVRRRQLIEADNALTNAKRELTKWLLPENTQVGETYCLPFGIDFVQVRVFKNGDHEIKIRKRS